jgi:conjugative transfer region protein TrbK
MRRPGKLLLAVAFGGLMLAVTVGVAMVRPESGGPGSGSGEGRASASVARDAVPGPANRNLAHCRTLTMPDSSCEAAWEARRRHFFGEDKPQ